MLVAEAYEWRRTRPGESVQAACCLLLLPLIITVLTAGFLGYAGWRLACLSWQFGCRIVHALQARHAARASARATTYP